MGVVTLLSTYTNQGRALANVRRLAASGVAEGVNPRPISSDTDLDDSTGGFKVLGIFVDVAMSLSSRVYAWPCGNLTSPIVVCVCVHAVVAVSLRSRRS